MADMPAAPAAPAAPQFYTQAGQKAGEAHLWIRDKFVRAATRHPMALGLTFALLIILTILFIVLFWAQAVDFAKYKKKYPAAEGFIGISNLYGGGNNPRWWEGSHDAGWGGPVHRSYNTGDSRVYGASGAHAVDDEDLTAKTSHVPGCSGPPNPGAVAEAAALYQAQASSAKNWSDSDLANLMYGGM